MKELGKQGRTYTLQENCQMWCMYDVGTPGILTYGHSSGTPTELRLAADVGKLI